MTLNASGPLSMGGSTTGQSINLELGASATALASINSTSFRTLAGVASGQISISNFYGKSNGPKQWMAVTHTNQSSSYNVRNFYDSSGNAYVTGPYTPAQPWQFYFQKWNSSNVSQFSNTYVPAGLSQNTMGGRGFFDSSGNLYFYGCFNVSPNNVAYITKISSSGTAQWSYGVQSTLTFNSFKQTNPRAITATSSAVILTSAFLGGQITGYDYCVCPPDPIYSYTTLDYVTKYAPSNGAPQWTYNYNAFSAPFNYVTMQGATQLSTGVIVLTCSTSPGSSGANKFSVVKLASDGSVSSAAYFNMTPYNSDQPAVEAVVDSSDNLVYSGDSGNDYYFFTVVKINTSSGTPNLAWSKLINISGSPSGYTTTGVNVDPSNNVYVVGYVSYGGAISSFVFKFNSAGTLQFAQRIQAVNPNTSAAYDIRVKSIFVTSSTMYLSFDGSAYGAGTQYAQYNLAVANDGSVAGTTTTVVYPPTGTGGAILSISNVTPTVTNGSLGSGTAFTPTRGTPGVSYPTTSVTTNAWTSQQTVASI